MRSLARLGHSPHTRILPCPYARLRWQQRLEQEQGLQRWRTEDCLVSKCHFYTSFLLFSPFSCDNVTQVLLRRVSRVLNFYDNLQCNSEHNEIAARQYPNSSSMAENLNSLLDAQRYEILRKQQFSENASLESQQWLYWLRKAHSTNIRHVSICQRGMQSTPCCCFFFFQLWPEQQGSAALDMLHNEVLPNFRNPVVEVPS